MLQCEQMHLMAGMLLKLRKALVAVTRYFGLTASVVNTQFGKLMQQATLKVHVSASMVEHELTFQTDLDGDGHIGIHALEDNGDYSLGAGGNAILHY